MDRSADWLRQGERDLKHAEGAAASGYHESAAFAAQRGAKRAVKASVQSLHGAVRGHAVTETLRQLGGRLDVRAELIAAAQELDKVYVTSRYPNGFESGAPADYFNERNSRELLSHARAIFEFCRSQIHRP